MKLAALLTLTLSAAPAPSVNDAAAKFEDPAVKDRLKLVTDGKGHYLAMDATGSYRGPFFYGDAKGLYQLRSSGGGASGNERFNVALWDPRIDYRVNGVTSFDWNEGKYSVSCHPKVTELTLVSAADAKKVLETAVLYQPKWTRRPHKLARDDKGNYFYVDCAREDAVGAHCGRDWRLYTGQRGKMKLQQMTNIVHDSEGEIFATKSGELRLVLTGGAERKESGLKWVAGKNISALINVPIEDNARMIYMDLGVYDRERLGTPCDDL